MTRINRRSFLYRSGLAGGALALEGLIARSALLDSGYRDLDANGSSGGYGPLQPVKSKNTGEALLALPEGFQYTVFGKTGSVMSDKTPTPPSHDGMAAFADRGGKIRLVRNHEVRNGFPVPGIAIGNKSLSYDAAAGGGTVTLIVDPATRELVKDFASLSGTLVNCAGGPTPWGSWITCEETVLGKTKITGSNGSISGGFEKSHGYCFEVSASADGQAPPVPLKAMGRFVHEAIAVDAATGIVYETEDRGMAGFYRFIPSRKGVLSAGGRLQMLAVKGQPKYDTRTGQKAGAKLPVIWVDIDDPDPAEADTNSLAVYSQGAAKGGATFARLEGCWYGDGGIYMSATSGGDKMLGQVWKYQPEGAAGGHLWLVYESPSVDLLQGPDNICVSPRGGLVICEDGSGVQHIRGLTKEGLIFALARNIMPGHEMHEFAGATFSPDGQTLFVNIQTPGLTFAIWGPWKDGSL